MMNSIKAGNKKMYESLDFESGRCDDGVIWPNDDVRINSSILHAANLC